MHTHTATLEAGKVLLRQGAPWLDEFRCELLAFPRGKHDDQVDALSSANDVERAAKAHLLDPAHAVVASKSDRSSSSVVRVCEGILSDLSVPADERAACLYSVGCTARMRRKIEPTLPGPTSSVSR